VVRAASDIDLHLFADDVEEVESFLANNGLDYTSETVSVRHGNSFIDYPHLYLEENETVIECTVYAPSLRSSPHKSSITGKPMQRADAKRLAVLIAESLGPNKPPEE
jgi:hypothetical protein